MNENLKTAGSVLIFITLSVTLTAYGLIQIWAGYLGIDYHFGGGWAIAAVAVALIFRFTLPVTIGAFFGAMNVWGWHWAGALVFAAPGLLFMALMIPGALASVLKKLRQSDSSIHWKVLVFAIAFLIAPYSYFLFSLGKQFDGDAGSGIKEAPSGKSTTLQPDRGTATIGKPWENYQPNEPSGIKSELAPLLLSITSSRVWTDQQGRQLTAELLSVYLDHNRRINGRFRRPNGEVFTYPIDSLSAQDAARVEFALILDPELMLSR
jgi:hypothetical protein